MRYANSRIESFCLDSPKMTTATEREEKKKRQHVKQSQIIKSHEDKRLYDILIRNTILSLHNIGVDEWCRSNMKLQLKEKQKQTVTSSV